MFVDIDGTFIGRLERHHWLEFDKHKKGEDIRFNTSEINDFYTEGEQFCYGDNITICDCKGLCKDK